MRKIFNELPKFIQSLSADPDIEKIITLISEPLSKNKDSKELHDTICNITYAIIKIKSSSKAIDAKNVTPDYCESTIDFRFPSGYEKDAIILALEKYLKKRGFSFDSSSEGYIELENIGSFGASLWEDWESSKDITTLSEIMTSIYKKKPFIGLFTAGTDAEYYREKDVEKGFPKYCEKVVLLGAGDYTLAHSPDEFVELEDFINIIKVYTLFAYRFLTDE